MEATKIARELKLRRRPGPVGRFVLRQHQGDGAGYRGDEFEERPSEPLVVFLADKTEPGAWNLPLYKIFADPFNTAGLVIDPKMHMGFDFEVHDLIEHKRIVFHCPEELYDMLVFIGAMGRYGIKAVYSRTLNEIAAVSSTQRLNLMAGRYGKMILSA